MHIYALAMQGKDIELLAHLRRAMDRQGWTQAHLAESIGVTQGHLSKILRQKVPLSRSARTKINALVGAVDRSQSPLEARTIEALRGSASFRNLVLAALKMHENA